MSTLQKVGLAALNGCSHNVAKPSMPSRLVKHLPHSLDVLAQARVIDELKNRQVDVGAGPVGALGA
jgi:hypothetical protein